MTALQIFASVMLAQSFTLGLAVIVTFVTGVVLVVAGSKRLAWHWGMILKPQMPREWQVTTWGMLIAGSVMTALSILGVITALREFF